MYGMAYVIIALAFGFAGGFVGRMKGSSFWMWFLVSLCVPFLGLLCAVLYRWDDRELRRQCPNCGKVVKLYDAVCVSCGEELEFPQEAIASEAASRARVAASPR
jgi:predicted RNA-binding Zn-ribbon protein involved in translation (DUF1610 family)